MDYNNSNRPPVNGMQNNQMQNRPVNGGQNNQMQNRPVNGGQNNQMQNRPVNGAQNSQMQNNAPANYNQNNYGYNANNQSVFNGYNSQSNMGQGGAYQMNTQNTFGSYNSNQQGYGYGGSVADGQIVSMGEWIITFLVSSIPIVGIIMLFVWAFGGGAKDDKKNYCRALLVITLIMAVVWNIVLMLFFNWIGHNFNDIMKSIVESSYYASY